MIPGGGAMDMSGHGVGESLASLVLRARLILLRNSRDAGGVGGPRAHASRIASTSAFSAAKFRSACGGSDRSSVVGLAGRALLTGAARGFAHAVDGTSSLSQISSPFEGGMVMMNFSQLKAD